jgi:mitogen-activated protein kinase kinase kinase 9
MVRGERYTKKTDVFSFGVLLYEIVTGERAYDLKLTLFQLINLIGNGRMPEVPKTVVPFVGDMIRSCWSLDPEKRPAFNEILCELRKNEFKVFPSVNPERIRQFVRELK